MCRRRPTQYPQDADQIGATAKTCFVGGADWVNVAVGLEATIVFFLFPRKDDERRPRAGHLAEDAATSSGWKSATRPQRKERSTA